MSASSPPDRSHPFRRRAVNGLVLGSTALLAVGLTPAVVSAAAPATRTAAHRPAPLASARSADDRQTQNVDLRSDDAAQATLQKRALRERAHPTQGLRTLRAQLGPQGVVDVDPLTGTPSSVSKLDGFLTGPSSAPAGRVVTSYVTSHLGALGLSAADLQTLRLRRTYVDIGGTRHLSYTQYAGSVPVFGNGLKASVTRDGRLVSVQGSPLHAPDSVGTAADLTASAARRAAVKDVGGTALSESARAPRGADRKTTFGNGDQASLVSFETVAGPRLAWQTLTRPAPGQMFLHVVDASSGRVLYRRNLVQNDSGNVWEYWPGKTKGGTAHRVDLTKPGWLPKGSPRLAGNNAHVWSDVNDDNLAQPSEEVKPGSASFRFPFVDFTRTDGSPCSPSFKCSWDSSAAGSWKRNRKQNAVQVFYYVNKMHDHLKAAPIGFNRAAGNFEAVDDDAVQTQPDDGANTGTGAQAGLPDSSHVDNANMGTPPDGTPPTMQMYLFNDPAAKDDPTTPADESDPFLQSNGGDEADVVYHEYTHGLSNRLVVDANGVSTLGNIQAGSMGEAWSDWYAMDFLVNRGFQSDSPSRADIKVGRYVGKNQDLIRTQPLDCKVEDKTSACHGTPGAGRGGYTYGDFGKIIGAPEVHADGEIWGETLWDLRRALGSRLSESLVTRAMELSPANPSYLDMRNSILQADTVNNHGKARATIWKVFAHRGMGYFAGAVDGDDAQPVEDFSLPPASGTPKGSLTGTITDDAAHRPVQGATVMFGGHASGFPTDYAATTGADGTYTISGIFAGTYPKVSAGGGGYDRQVHTVSVSSGANRLDWALRRDWAALSGGASVTDTNDDSGAPYGCGAAAMFDQSQAQGWSANRVVTGGVVQPVHVVVKLPQAVDVTQVAIDPSGTCGDAGSASTSGYSLETSTDGTTWTTASSGTFGLADRNRFSSPTLAPGSSTGVRYVRYTMKDSQVAAAGGSCPGPYSGCDFIDSRELEVYGTPSAP